MIYEDFKQLTAYTRYDGIYLAIIWAASFACLLGITILPVLAQFSFFTLYFNSFLCCLSIEDFS